MNLKTRDSRARFVVIVTWGATFGAGLGLIASPNLLARATGTLLFGLSTAFLLTILLAYIWMSVDEWIERGEKE